ncbi:glycerophosphodiester phosphodiesterase [Streptacidiphilus sp. P02-A3a]|uniref:glycerophosphodiester phosphodiesterase n=1 Tax=Streptacidiphilus sp. P02-A3a TaxID=2704468 RepID=UPI0015FBD532|nr:glycerophosphodiester phosphodiesterase [Streptacidiphilus sp. P02-A3a]QMU69473.1 glycerophosphodiester phosphodiesterase [Streptacidiphilus sp. P02-A3a]
MTLAVAHRGDPLRYRENTLPSVASAITEGADWVEVDVRLTRDGVPVLLHDPTLLRLWRHDRRIDALTFAEVTALSGGGIPRLRAALELALDHGVPLMLDLPAPAEGRAALALVRALDCPDRVVFTGAWQALAEIRREAPAALIAMSWESPLPPRPELVRQVRPDYFNQYHRWLTAGRIARLHRKGLKVSTWTVDRAPAMAALAAAGVDAIISNDLRTLRRTLAARTPEAVR